MPLKKSLLTLMLLVCVAKSYGQDIPGYNISNYAGINGIFLQPASIADSRYKFDMELAGAGVTLGNNYVHVIRKWYKHLNDQPAVDWKQAGYVGTLDNNNRKYVDMNSYVTLPSFMISLNKNMSIAFTARERTFLNVDHLNPDLARLMYNGFDVPDLFNLKLSNDRFNINTMSWGEYGLGYGQVIKGGGPHFLKVGGQVKFITGLAAGYFYAKNLSYSWKNKDTLNLFSSQFGYGTSDNMQITLDQFRFQYVTNPAIGLDLGAVYEFRPHYNDYVYDMDGKQGLERRDQNKYKLRLGVSLLDLGRIKFKRSPNSGDFNADIQNWDVKHISLGQAPIASLSDTLKARFGFSNNASSFTMALPTAFSIQADYNVWKDFYVNFTSYVSPRFIKTESKVHALNYYAFGPRWDYKWFGVMMPISINGYGQTHLGATFRLGPVVVGTSNVGAFLFQKYITGYDLHVALKIPIMYGKPKDRDHDGVSNKKDQCPDKAGTWAMHGCPDKDGDGIEDSKDKCPTVYGSPKAQGCPDMDNDSVPDKEDHCPDKPGTVAAHGCPDMDNDGVPDDVDKCIDKPGKKENGGCPDTDNDGVFDDVDKCPDLAGPKDNNGCPYGDRDKDSVLDKDDKCPDVPGDKAHFGCPDSDGDGVYDNEDQCPQVAGSPANHGCPEKPAKVEDTDKDGVPDNVDKCPNVAGSPEHAGCPDTDGDGVYDDVDQCVKTKGLPANNGCPEVKKEDKAILKKVYNNLEFEPHSATITPSSYPSLDELVKLMKEHPKYRLRVAGYTDSVGSAEANLALSRHRAIAVQVYLFEHGGIDPGRVDIEAHGEADPIDDNGTEEGRKHNRRVEINIKFE